VSAIVSAHRFKRALALYPAIAHAVQPKPLGAIRENPVRVGAYPYCVENYFFQSQVQARTVRERRESSTIIGPLCGGGDCLEPLRYTGDAFWFDTSLEARVGDIVLFLAPDSFADNEPINLQNPLNFKAKLLVEFADELWLAHRSGMYPLDGIKILGVEVPAPIVCANKQFDIIADSSCRA